MDIPAADLNCIRELYARGRYRQALEAAQPLGPLVTWSNAPARLLAGRLAMQLGAPRLGRKLHAAAYRSTPSNLEAVYYHARYRFEKFGPLSAWRFMVDQVDWSDASPDLRADWLALNAFVLSRLRDHDRAERYLEQAVELAPKRAWIEVERAAVLEAADRPDDALAAARRSLDLQPWFRPAVQAVAHLLQKTGHDADAEEFLAGALPHLESGIVWAHRAALQLELGRPEAALESLSRYEDLSPLLDRDGRKWLAARRADALYALDRRGEAARQIGDFTDEFHQRFSANLTDPSFAARRATKIAIETPPSPATPSIAELLTAHWRFPYPAAPADAPQPIDGLPDTAERQRAEAAGWICREFTLTREVAAELVAAGLPFHLSLVEVGVTQTRLVVGHDPVRDSVFLLEGHESKPVEAPLAILLKRFAATGPRAMVAVPQAEAHRLSAIGDLPDHDAYDRLHGIARSFGDGHQADARAALDAFRAEYAGHRLVKVAALQWARLTAHPVLALRAIEDMLVDFPDDSTLAMARAGTLRELGRTRERIAHLAAAAAKPDADALILQSYAQALLTDPDRQALAERLLRKSIRARPQAAAGYFLLASQSWERDERSAAADLYRFACCLDDREEQFAETYVRVARHLGQTQDAIRLFQRRAFRTETPYPPAIRALAHALLEREESDLARAALDSAIDRARQQPVAPSACSAPISKPASALGELLLFRGESFARRRDFPAAEADLESARPLVPAATVHRVAARIARLKPDSGETLDHLKAALAEDPSWHDGHRLIVGALVESHGVVAARAYLGALANRHPYSYPIQRLRAELLSPLPDEAAVTSIERLLELCPEDAWARRQLALVLADRQRDSEALEHIRIAGEFEPDHPSHFAVLGHVHRRAERIDAAQETYRDALRLDPDHELAANELVRLARGRAERNASLSFLVDRLHSSPHTGDGLVAYRDLVLALASEEADSDELVDELYRELDRALDDRPDLWQAWSLMIQQLGLMQRLDEARTVALDAVERFPLIAQLWSDLARVHGAADHTDERLEALRTAVAIAPDFAPVAIELAEALTDSGEEDAAIQTLERAAIRSPLDAQLQVALADRLWNAGRSDEALARAELAVRFDPGLEIAWRLVLHWSDRLDRPETVIELARELTRTRPGDARGWLKLSRLLHAPEQNAEALAALETVIRLDPLNVEAHDQKAERLAEMGRYDEAIEAARPGDLVEDLPFVLQGRAAWVEAKRGNYARAIPPMQRLVSVEPEYFWGWQQLAEWYSETDRKTEYLEATDELVRLKPDHPMPLTMRGDAKLKTNDRSGAKADLRDALRLAPQYAPAAAILFDTCLADGEIREARMALAVLQEHAGGSEVLVKQIQLACRTEDAEAALRTLAELAALPGEGPPVALQLALAEIEASGWDDRAARVLHDAFADDEPFSPWAPLFWIDTTAGEDAGFEERLAAVETAIRRHPTFAPAHDRKAELLAGVGRFDEALAACTAPATGDPPPITLRGRAAWIEAKRGHRSKAISLMKAVVADDPNYLWGWRNLAQWYDAEGRKKECLDAAERMVQLAPDDPVSFGYRGEARRAMGDRTGAKSDFARAFDLDPRFDAAGLHLIAEQLHAQEIEAAAKTLARVRENTDGPLVKLRAVEVASRQGDLVAARSRFRALASDPDAPVALVREAASALDRVGWTAETDEELDAIARGVGSTSAAAAVWADRRIGRGRETDVLESLAEIFARNPDAGREATLGYAIAMASHGQSEKTATTIHRFADHLRADLEGWAKAGAALAAARQYALAASWLGDWPHREGVTADMLAPLADSLRALDRDRDAAETSRAALRLAGNPAAYAVHRAWLSFEAALAGDSAAAGALLGLIDRIGLPDRTRLVVALAEAMTMVGRAGPHGKSNAFAEARAHLAAAVDACEPGDVPPGLARRYRHVVKRIAADAGGVAARIWAWWQHTRPMLK
jgi:tetratricopeptide (TPR) repeat protein